MEQTAVSFRYPFEKEAELVESVCTGDHAQARRLLNELLGCIFFDPDQRISIARTRVFELLVILSRASAAHGMPEERVFPRNERWLEEIMRFDDIGKLCVWLVDVVTQVMETADDDQHGDISDSIRAAEQYIRKNCMKKLTLTEVAEHVYLSPSYFSRIFREETGMCFSEYLNRARVERAKRLIQTSGIRRSHRGKLGRVAEESGFEDPSYFCKVFKRITGMTPREFYAACNASETENSGSTAF